MKSVNKFPAKKEFQRQQKKLKPKHPNKPRFRHLLKFKLNFFFSLFNLFRSFHLSHPFSRALSHALVLSLSQLAWLTAYLSHLSLSFSLDKLEKLPKVIDCEAGKKIKQEKSSKTKSLFLPLVTISALISFHLCKKNGGNHFKSWREKMLSRNLQRSGRKKLAICQQLNFSEADKNTVCLCFIMTAKQSLVPGRNIK